MKPSILLPFAVASLVLVSGCAKTSSTNISAQQTKSASVPHRIVSLTPNNTEILFALGLEDRVVGVTSYCDYPPEAKKKPKVGDMNVSLERVVALDPDLVLAHAYLNDNVTRQLEKLKVPIIGTDPKTIAEVISDIRKIGKATGKSGEAEKIVRSMESTIDRVRKESAGKNRPRVLVVIQPSPLWVGGPKTFVDEMIGYANGENIAHDAKPGFKQFSTEAAIGRDPEVIIVGNADEKKQIENSSIWRKTTAVREGRVVLIDSALLVRPGPRLAEGLEELAKALRASH